MNWKRIRSFLGIQEPNTLSREALERVVDKAAKQIEDLQAQIELAYKSGYNTGRDAQFFWDDPKSNVLPPDADTAFESYRNWQREHSYQQAVNAIKEQNK